MTFEIEGWEFEGYIDRGGDIQLQVWLPREVPDRSGNTTHSGDWVEPFELVGADNGEGERLTEKDVDRIETRAVNCLLDSWSEVEGMDYDHE